ncbi:hypothetical protein ACERIM_00840 [Natrinema sp. H-ect1]|uniref:hypothetical protein n=1 Tax=Natrinema sp. H-ect1 TaxID=3242700 RepID=UPI00359D48E6
MSTTTDRDRREIESDLGQEVPPEEPTRATLEIGLRSRWRPDDLDQLGQEEWTLEFNDEGECVDCDPPARLLPSWLNDTMELVRGEL